MARRRPFHRTDRLNSQLKEVLAVALQRETREELLRSLVLTDVTVTRDLSVARVYYYPMQGDPDAVAQALSRATGFLRRRVGKEIRARQVPELRFILDASIDHGRRIEQVLSELDIPPDSEDDGGGDHEPSH